MRSSIHSRMRLSGCSFAHALSNSSSSFSTLFSSYSVHTYPLFSRRFASKSSKVPTVQDASVTEAITRATDEHGRLSLRALTKPQLESWVEHELQEKPYRARQLWRWLYKEPAQDVSEITDINKAIKAKLKRKSNLHALTLHSVCVSSHIYKHAHTS